MDVVMPDGTVIENVPEGTTKLELMRKLGLESETEVALIPDPVGIPQETPEPPSAFEAFGRAAVLRMLDNFGTVPEGVVNSVLPRSDNPSLIPGPLEAAAGLTKLATGGTVDPTTAAENVRPDIEGALSGENILAAIATQADPISGRSASRPISERFEGEQERQRERTQQFTEQAPVATTAGNLAGDIGTILAGRAGLRKVGISTNFAEAAPKVSNAAQTAIVRSLKAFGRSAAKSGARVAETGIEASVLSALQRSSPEDIAQIGAGAAGSQVVGDVALSVYRGIKKRGGVGQALLLGTVVSLGAQQLTPGGLDRVLPTLESVNKNLVLSWLLGGGVGVLAGGRVPQGFAGPAFAEVANTVRRGALFSLLGSVAKDSVQTAPVVQKFTEDPDFFGPKAKQLLTRAINSEKIDVRNTVDRLMKNSDFRKKFEGLPLTGNP